MEKIKQFIEGERGKDILTILILILVGLGSFELGRLSHENKDSGVRVTYPPLEANAVSAVNQNTQNISQPKPVIKTTQSTTKTITGAQNYFASNRGTKYYPIGCSAGGTIKQENRIYFKTVAEAEQAGYVLSSSCR
jgi:hypothetical protein